MSEDNNNIHSNLNYHRTSDPIILPNDQTPDPIQEMPTGVNGLDEYTSKYNDTLSSMITPYLDYYSAEYGFHEISSLVSDFMKDIALPRVSTYSESDKIENGTDLDLLRPLASVRPQYDSLLEEASQQSKITAFSRVPYLPSFDNSGETVCVPDGLYIAQSAIYRVKNSAVIAIEIYGDVQTYLGQNAAIGVGLIPKSPTETFYFIQSNGLNLAMLVDRDFNVIADIDMVWTGNKIYFISDSSLLKDDPQWCAFATFGPRCMMQTWNPVVRFGQIVGLGSLSGLFIDILLYIKNPTPGGYENQKIMKFDLEQLNQNLDPNGAGVVPVGNKGDRGFLRNTETLAGWAVEKWQVWDPINRVWYWAKCVYETDAKGKQTGKTKWVAICSFTKPATTNNEHLIDWDGDGKWDFLNVRNADGWGRLVVYNFNFNTGDCTKQSYILDNDGNYDKKGKPAKGPWAAPSSVPGY